MTLRLDPLVAWFETLSPDTVREVPKFYAADALFRDPFNNVRGIAAIERIYAHLFTQVQAPRFEVVQRLVDGADAVLVWDFRFGTPVQVVRGASHLRLDAQGRITHHRDYWDTAEELYARLPVLGWLMRVLRNKLSATRGWPEGGLR